MKILNDEKYRAILKEFGDPIFEQPAIFVADYASYNEGHICGVWFDLANYSDYDSFLERIHEFFARLDKVAPLDFFYPREEIMYQDYQCFPRHLYSESGIDQSLWDYLDFCQDKGSDLIDAYISAFGDLPKDIQTISDRLFATLDEGSSSTELRMGYYCHDAGMIEIPQHLENYFDYESYGNDVLQDMYDQDPYIFNPQS